MFGLTTLLTVLKYSGIVLAAGSTIWALTHELYTKDEHNKRHLTGAGKVALGMIILGLLLTLNTAALEAVSKKRDKEQADTKEAQREQKIALENLAQKQQQEADRQEKREADRLHNEKIDKTARETREQMSEAEMRAAITGAAREQRQTMRQFAATSEIIFASQPLRSLGLSWTFENVPDHLLTPLNQAQSDVQDRIDDDEMKFMDRNLFDALGNAWKRRDMLYPWLNSLAVGQFDFQPTMVLIALDDEAAAILPFGVLANHKSRGLVESKDDVFAYNFDPNANPMVSLPLGWDDPCPRPRLNVAGAAITIETSLSPACLNQDVNLTSSTYFPSARLPATITILVLGAIKQLPVKIENVTQAIAVVPWRTDANPIADFPARSQLILRPNGVEGFTVKYEMKFLGRKAVAVGGGQENKPEVFCQAAIFRGSATPR